MITCLCSTIHTIITIIIIDIAPFEALYRRTCRYHIRWFEVVQFALTCPHLVHEAMEKIYVIRERLKMTQSWHKSYASALIEDLEFDFNDWKFHLRRVQWDLGRKGSLVPVMSAHIWFWGKLAKLLMRLIYLMICHLFIQFSMFPFEEMCWKFDIYSPLRRFGS